ncbi:hypothetical protein [Aromatoleum evansii]|uniref:hypothetical protein n=1 Tax=Aromatoleum evansii TaxID=59406 RepID=UPI00145F3B2A|nr:hypothetical protein [Aromatoleum evansii]NMG32060.1 hypothetical protein [Aromatoleum evansii]
MNRAPKTRDYFAEMYVAGVLADAGWQIYFPRRDVGFDFIAIKSHGEQSIIRPIQVKGKYPTETKTDKQNYGYDGKLTQVHPEMVLAIPFFSHENAKAPECVAYMPRGQLRDRSTEDRYYTFPALFRDGKTVPRRDFRKFFDERGLRLLLSSSFSTEEPGASEDADPCNTPDLAHKAAQGR